MIVLNLKTYEQSFSKIIEFANIAREVAAETGVRIIVCPPHTHLREAVSVYEDIFAQHADPNKLGAFTGSMPAQALAQMSIKGSLLNHSEKKLLPEKIGMSIASLKSADLESLVCAESTEEAKKIALFKPDYIAVEPPELIGSGISVSSAKPEIVTNSVREIKAIDKKITVLCGAGVSNADDTKKALALGAEGVLLASAFVKAEDPKKFLSGLASVF